MILVVFLMEVVQMSMTMCIYFTNLNINGIYIPEEQIMPFNSGLPPHYHKDMDEMFYIIDGEMTIWIEGKIHKLIAGNFAMVPKGTVHYFKITSHTPCKALNMYTPGGFEKGIIRNAQETKILTLPPAGLPYKGSTDKNDMHIAVDVAPLDLIALSENL